MRQSSAATLARRRAGSSIAKFPARGEERSIRPAFQTSFSINPGSRIFTIGSCFARRIEERLTGFDVPTLSFKPPRSESPVARASNALLNEYNPGSMAQRISYAMAGRSLPLETIVEVPGGFVDLSLPGGPPVTYERVVERRQEITTLYSQLKRSDVCVITLGFIEAWFDTLTQTYLNQMPPQSIQSAEPDRFCFERIDLATATRLLDEAVAALAANGIKVILTVSPVPLQSTFSGQDAVLANEYSKSTLLLCAQSVAEKHTGIDYFPSYEMVRQRGFEAYDNDNVHVLDEVASEVTSYMIGRYLAA